MAVNRRYDIFAVIALVLCIVAYASFRTEYRLRESMPAEFFDPLSLAPEKREPETKIASAYWKCAVKEVQWTYGYAQRLPEQPPPTFVAVIEDSGRGTDAATRLRYWQRLRSVWGVSAIWEEHYGLSGISLTDSLRSAGAWLEIKMRRLLGY
jgi:hypothetical protein